MAKTPAKTTTKTKNPAPPAKPKKAGNKITKRNADGKIPKLEISHEEAFELLIRMDYDTKLPAFVEKLNEDGIKISLSLVKQWSMRHKWMERRDEIFGNHETRLADAFKRLCDAYENLTAESMVHGAQALCLQALKNKLDEATIGEVWTVFRGLSSMSGHVPQAAGNIGEGGNISVLDAFRNVDPNADPGAIEPTGARSELGTFSDKVVDGGNAR